MSSTKCKTDELSNFKNKSDTDKKVVLESRIFDFASIQKLKSQGLDVPDKKGFHFRNKQVRKVNFFS